MRVSQDGTTLHMDADVLQQLLIIRDRFRDGAEGNARLYHDDGRMYHVHLYGQYAFRIVNLPGGPSHCVYTTLKINPSESDGHVTSCTIASDTREHRFITLPSTGVVRAAVVLEERFPRAIIEEFLARVCSVTSVELTN